jgi:hypothetical protein
MWVPGVVGHFGRFDRSRRDTIRQELVSSCPARPIHRTLNVSTKVAGGVSQSPPPENEARVIHPAPKGQWINHSKLETKQRERERIRAPAHVNRSIGNEYRDSNYGERSQARC